MILGLVISPPTGYYIEIVPRSSISKTGYMLANSVGTIDPGYTGNIYIALVKVVPDAPESMQLPFTKCQFVLRKAYYGVVKEVDNINGNDNRGEGGFGSTGSRNTK